MSAVWKQLALSDDLPITYSGGKAGLVPPKPDNNARDLYLDSGGNWTAPVISNHHGDARNFQKAVNESPAYTDEEIGRHLSFVKGLSIASISADGTNVTIITNREHGIIQGDISGGATITITGCSNSAYNGTKTPNGAPSTKSITFAETDQTAVTLLGYVTTSGVANSKDDYMLHWASDVGLADHSVALSKLPELTAMRVIGSTDGGDAEEIVVAVTAPVSGSKNLITSGSMFTALADKLDLSGGTMTSHLNLEDQVHLQLGTAGDTDYIYSDGDDIHISKDDNEVISVLDSSVKFNDNAITHAKTVGFQSEHDNGSKTASFDVNFATAQKQKVTLTANSMTITLDDDISVGNYLLKVINGGLATITWAGEGSGTVKWVGSSIPSLTSSGTDILSFYFDGTDFYGASSLNFV